MNIPSIPDVRRALALAASASLLTLLTGCVLGPVDEKPVIETPETWNNKTAETEAVVPDRWWTTFGDEGLTIVVDRALENSPSIDAAFARVRAARAAVGLAGSGLWPSINGGGSYSRARNTESTLFPAAGGRTLDNYGVNASVGYELDLWGRIRNGAEAAENDYRSAHADLAAARLLIAAETTRIWFDLYQAKAERLVIAETIVSRSNTYDLYLAREKAGIIGGDDVSRAKLDVAQARFDHEAVELRIVLLRNALATAVGVFPGTQLPEPADLLPSEIPALPVNIPSALLKNRPDIAAADLRLDASLRRQGAARANYYPNLTLAASGGFSSISASDLFQQGSRVWSFGPTLSLPIFTGGRNDAEMENSRAVFEGAWADYRATVLSAFRETEDALVSIDRLATQEKVVSVIVDAASETLTFAKARYDKGLSSNLEVTVAERDTLAARREFIRVRFERLRATANLARALGGGWNRDVKIEESQHEYEERLKRIEEEKENAKDAYKDNAEEA